MVALALMDTETRLALLRGLKMELYTDDLHFLPGLLGESWPNKPPAPESAPEVPDPEPVPVPTEPSYPTGDERFDPRPTVKRGSPFISASTVLRGSPFISASTVLHCNYQTCTRSIW